MALCRSTVAGESLLGGSSSSGWKEFLQLRCDGRLSTSRCGDAGGSSAAGDATYRSRRRGRDSTPSLRVACGSTSSSCYLESTAHLETRCSTAGDLEFAPFLGLRGMGGGFGSSGMHASNSRYGRAKGYWMAARALGGTGTDRVEDAKTGKASRQQDLLDVGDMQALDGGEWSVRPMVEVVDEADPSWEQINMVFRVVYAAVMYGGLAFAGNVLCNVIGLDCWGGFRWDAEVALAGLGYAMPPMVLLLVILEDEVVKNCSAARAIRDVEDNEIMDFFAGMSTWQFAFVVAAGALSEELFFRASIQGGLAHALEVTGSGGIDDTVYGVASLTGFIPLFVPFAHGLAAFLTSSLIGSMYYIISSPKDPKYIIAHSNQGRRDLKKRVEVWHERRQLRKIYSPLMEALLALYLGLEWMQTGNIMATMITHCLYSTVVVGTGLRRIHDQRTRLRERVKDVVGHSMTAVTAPEQEDFEVN